MNAELRWSTPPADPTAIERPPRKHRHVWTPLPGANAADATMYGCLQHVDTVWRDEQKARRGKSARRLGHDGERRSEKRYGWRKVGEYGGITDLEGTLAIVQQKTSRRLAPSLWRTVFAALVGRAGGRIPLLLLSFVRQGVPSDDYIVIRAVDWLALHGRDEPNQPVLVPRDELLHPYDPGYPHEEVLP